LYWVALLHKRSRNNLMARLAVPHQWRHRVDPNKWQRLTGHRQINPMGRLRVSLMDRLQVNLAGGLRGRA
jgi:hypothetical protein